MNDTGNSLTTARTDGLRLSVLSFGVTIFVGAFLLFQVQPIIARFILPWFGGTTDVWTTCMLYFQTMLLAGYAYAHASATWLRPRAQAVVHLALIGAALALLPIAPSDAWQPADASQPVLRILTILLACTGLPFFVLAATSPLMQSWFARTRQGRSPYRFYAVSNAGSLLALVSYPFLVEPLLGRIDQSWVWSAGVGLFAVLSVPCVVQLWLSRSARPAPEESAAALPDAPTLKRRLGWIILPAIGSVLLLGTTNLITQDLAPVPFLWLLPLTLYLLTFVLCFHAERWYRRDWMLGGLVAACAGVVFFRYAVGVGLTLHVGVTVAAMFFGCMICHGEVFRVRPAARRLTGYYLSISLGGALGGALVALVAPLVLNDYLEIYLALSACVLLAVWARKDGVGVEIRWLLTTAAVGGAALVALAPAHTIEGHQLLLQSRNFYGVLSVEEFKDGIRHFRAMRHGTTVHGHQALLPEEARTIPVGYYGAHSGVGVAMRLLADQTDRTIGVIGLGTGTIATYGLPGDRIRFYEINPEVQRLAEEYFTYLGDSAAEVDVVLRDGRLAVAAEPSGSLDVLVVDAFSSDAIPVHLLTKEAFAIYLDRLKPDGVLVLHLTNRYLKLEPIALRLAADAGWPAYWVANSGEQLEGTGEHPSRWVVVTRREGVLDDSFVQSSRVQPPETVSDVPVWTDDHVNLLQAIGRR